MLAKVESYKAGYEKGLKSLKGKIRMLFIFFLIEVCLASPFIGKAIYTAFEHKYVIISAVERVKASPQAELSQQQTAMNATEAVEEIVKSPTPPVDDIVEKTRWYESQNGTKGLALTCKDKGLSNEYGYRASKGFCFNNHEEATETVKNWFIEKLAIMDLATANCLYTGNGMTTDCNRAKQIAYESQLPSMQ